MITNVIQGYKINNNTIVNAVKKAENHEESVSDTVQQTRLRQSTTTVKHSFLRASNFREFRE